MDNLGIILFLGLATLSGIVVAVLMVLDDGFNK